MRSFVRIFLAIVTAVAGTLLFTSPANAIDEKECRGTQHKEFATPGTDVDFYITLCVWRTGSRYDAEAFGSWSDGGGIRKFDAFRVEIRLEKNDGAVTYNSCNYRDAINDNSSRGFTCGTASAVGSGNGWTADATILYNYDMDGKGEYFWNLTGSPVI
ncbi:hypothetical protein [Streptomyces sp. enrichment culture]|uniref:hypothetical protein n=1 Tax=Streptomyces sp. enrichment culture TaxID=1795815 RepID=UPI003F5499A4